MSIIVQNWNISDRDFRRMHQGKKIKYRAAMAAFIEAYKSPMKSRYGASLVYQNKVVSQAHNVNDNSRFVSFPRRGKPCILRKS